MLKHHTHGIFSRLALIEGASAAAAIRTRDHVPSIETSYKQRGGLISSAIFPPNGGVRTSVIFLSVYAALVVISSSVVNLFDCRLLNQRLVEPSEG